MIIGIVCVDNNWNIGKDNQLLFHLPEDMKFFRETTKNHIVCMGRKTLLSFPNSQPLKNRTNVILCSPGIEFEGCICKHSLEDMIDYIKSTNEDVYIIGGASFYKTMLPYYDKVLVTKVNAEKEADSSFPNLDELNTFKIINKSDIINTNGYDIQFLTYERTNR